MMESLIDRVIQKRASEQMVNFNYRLERKNPVSKEVLPRLVTKTKCRWCKADITNKAVTCRHCHHKLIPCVECGGPVGRSTQGLECWECVVGYSSKKQRAARNKNRKNRKAVLEAIRIKTLFNG